MTRISLCTLILSFAVFSACSESTTEAAGQQPEAELPAAVEVEEVQAEEQAEEVPAQESQPEEVQEEESQPEEVQEEELQPGV